MSLIRFILVLALLLFSAPFLQALAMVVTVAEILKNNGFAVEKKARQATSPVRSANASPTLQTEVNERELTALKAVIKCIEDHKLEEQYPIDPLQKQAVQLEKTKLDRNRAT
ncbi:FRIGIDA-like protein 3 [Apium graveolens]|uniref:FRIGIDA-like protein 3 n=1 Tax=Apium graveolens TaxID=4045 RepID=UPI003D7A93F2